MRAPQSAPGRLAARRRRRRAQRFFRQRHWAIRHQSPRRADVFRIWNRHAFF
jgi:hypothetical protein